MNYNCFKPPEGDGPTRPPTPGHFSHSCCVQQHLQGSREKRNGALPQLKAYQQNPLYVQLHQFPSPALGMAAGVLVPAEGKGKASAERWERRGWLLVATALALTGIKQS